VRDHLAVIVERPEEDGHEGRVEFLAVVRFHCYAQLPFKIEQLPHVEHLCLCHPCSDQLISAFSSCPKFRLQFPNAAEATVASSAATHGLHQNNLLLSLTGSLTQLAPVPEEGVYPDLISISTWELSHAWNEEDEHTTNFTQLFLSISLLTQSFCSFRDLAGKGRRTLHVTAHKK
jgi:hypothetical protein